MTRTEKSRRAIELRGKGLTVPEVAEVMGCRPGTVYNFLDDPDGSKLKARKESYRGECEQCGKRTDGARGPGKAPRICQDCYVVPREWPDERIVEAIQDWAKKHGKPPSANDWHQKANGDDRPAANTLLKHGGWSHFIRLAGFEPRPWRAILPEEVPDIVEKYRLGATAVEIAEEYGCDSKTIRNHLHKEGVDLGWHRVTEAQREKALDLYEEGLPVRAIAEDVGISTATVHRIRREAGLSRYKKASR